MGNYKHWECVSSPSLANLSQPADPDILDPTPFTQALTGAIKSLSYPQRPRETIFSGVDPCPNQECHSPPLGRSTS